MGTPDVICMLLASLAGHTGDKWPRCVLSIRRRQIREPELVDFIEVVNDEAPYSQSQQLISMVRDHQKAHNKFPNIKETS